MFYVYKITNLINGKIYIGKTYDIKTRWQNHCAIAKQGPEKANKNGNHRFGIIHASIRKHGSENFQMEEIFRHEDELVVKNKEIELIASFKSQNKTIGYNCTDGGDGATGFRFTEEQKVQLSLNKIGMYAGDKNPFYGKTHSEESRKKISEKNKGKLAGEKNPQYGKHPSQEVLDKIAATKATMNFNSITKEQAKEIHQKYIPRKYSKTQLAKDYDIHPRTIQRILNCSDVYSYCLEFQSQYTKSNKDKILTKEEVREIYEKHNTGTQSCVTLSADYNVRPSAIYNILNAYKPYEYCKNWERLYPIQFTFTLQQLKEVKEMSAIGISHRKIAKKYNTSEITVSNALKSNNTTSEPPSLLDSSK